MKNILLIFTDENYDGKFSSVIYDRNSDKIKKNKNILSKLLTFRLAGEIANKYILSDFKRIFNLTVLSSYLPLPPLLQFKL